MTPWLWLAAWVGLLLGSVVAHEYGHVVAGRRFGWDFHGWKLTWLGPKVIMGHRSKDMRDWRLGVVAVAGPCATLLCTSLFVLLSQLPIEHNWVFGQLALLNFVLFVVNLLPIPGSDGAHVILALTGKRLTWKRAGLVWLAFEVAATAVVIALHAT